ncbi:unnamed protein product [Somion occarium]|uniref:Uncharacterized protein n=1 Tax=Somion occarium TaxID=3059160 RepID=A0ABP1E2P9_9APHY
MALTATVQSVYPPERTWDEVIVPTLRKRLEDESHVLSKRMSAASMASLEDRHPLDSYQANMVYVSREKTVSPVSQYPKPSAIPRPSLSHSRTDTSSSSFERSSRSGSFNRALRPPSSRSNSPMNSMKATRIPISRGRTGSTSSYQPSINGNMAKSESRTTLSKYNGHNAEPSAELWPVDERQPHSSVNSRSTLRTPRSQHSQIANENAPFSQSSLSSRSGYDYDVTPARPSIDSEEAPFEHWYRGDISRNGGVGELRVARKQEMLDIANYGHTLRQASPRVIIGSSSRSRSTSRGRENHQRTRARTGSFDGNRESIYISDEHTRVGTMVLDEQPLTDIDTDVDASMEMTDEDANERLQYTPRTNGTYSPPMRSETPTSTRDLSNFRSRIPTPTPKVISEPPRTPTPTQALRGASEPPPSTSTSSPPTPRKSAMSQSQSQPGTTSQGQSNKRRGKSPGPALNGTAAKKTKTSKSPARSPPKKTQRDMDVRRSISQYPNPEGDDVVDAIPSWTQPIPASGNWDDVVLPVVARKKGLDGHYAHADGSPKPKPPTETVYEPAPGTFGFDYSKYRPPRTDTSPNEIPMDEFGQRKEPVQEQPSEQLRMALSPSPISPASAAGVDRSRSRAESPAPFSHYAAPEKPDGIPRLEASRSPAEQPANFPVEEETSGGCCKCIIM